MAIEGDNVDANLLLNTRDHGHFFTKKNFTKRPSYCHHCCESIWGLFSTGFVCEVCNFTCHEKCLKTVASYCSGVALQMIKNPVAHSWSEPSHIKRKFCCVCRKRTDDSSSVKSVECEVCEYYVHVDCQDLAVSDCKEASTYTPSARRQGENDGREAAAEAAAAAATAAAPPQHHHWREGNLPSNCKCAVCKKNCVSTECLAGMRCEWCQTTVHSACYRQMTPECDFGVLRKIMLPPRCLSIPRTELPMDQLLNIDTKQEADKPGTSHKIEKDEGSVSSGDDSKEKDDSQPLIRQTGVGCHRVVSVETLRIFDGNTSLRNHVYRTASVPKTASAQHIRDAALRTFHIQDKPENYYVTQVVDDEGTEEPLEDTMPLRSVKRLDNRKAHVYLRYRDALSGEASIRVYGSWLRIPVTFCTVPVTKETRAEAVVAEALANFGLDRNTGDRYNLVEVSLDRGVAERTVGPQLDVLQLVQDLRKGSLRRFQLVRFYLQEKEDPDGTNVSVFIGELPVNLSQRQYERLLLRLLGAQERPFTTIIPIYYEYGSLVVTFNSPKAAANAVSKLSNAPYEDKSSEPSRTRHLLALCLPNIEKHMVPTGVEPLLVMVNVNSGGKQGVELIKHFRKLLNPFQVFDVTKGGPLVGLYVFRNISKYKILACGGDGTIGWVLQSLDNVKQDAACFSPPCAVVPLGTGNDLARVLRWGSGYSGDERPIEILKDVTEAEEIKLDRWTVVFHEEERSSLPSADESNQDQQMMNPEELTSMIIMNNYFGIGVDAEICLKFHEDRQKYPEQFSSQLLNKFYYAQIGFKTIFKSHSVDLHKRIQVEVDGKPIELPVVEGIIVLNILSWGSGANPWGTAKEEAFRKSTHYDGLLEIVGVKGATHLGHIKGPLRQTGIRIAQGGHIKIVTHEDMAVQVDGEPQKRPPGTITILKSALTAVMLRKPSRRLRKSRTIPSAPLKRGKLHKLFRQRLGKSLTRLDATGGPETSAERDEPRSTGDLTDSDESADDVVL